MPSFICQTPAVIAQTERLLWSFEHWTGRSLLNIPDKNPAILAAALFASPSVVVSHGTEADPIFNYANQQALDLWELDWDSFTRMPSKQSVEPDLLDERQQMLAQIKDGGCYDGYEGIRISKSGKRFSIKNVTIWKVIDAQGIVYGQAATFADWTFL